MIYSITGLFSESAAESYEGSEKITNDAFAIKVTAYELF